MAKNISNDIASRFSSRIKQRVASTRSGRFDFRLSDYEVADKSEARILVAYTKEMGTPKRTQLDEWVTSSFNGTFSLALETLKNYPDLSAVTAMVHKNERYLPFERTAGMVAVGSNRYMDDDSVWEVRQTDAGERLLVRVAKDDIDMILSERQSRERTASIHHRLRLADITDAGVADLDLGDRISYMHLGMVQRGEVAYVGDDTVHVKDVFNASKTRTIPKTAVIDVHEKSPKARKAHEAFLVDFFTKAYGDAAFARTLVTLENTGL